MKFLNRIKNDKGVNNSISFMVIIAFVMVMLISFIDVGLYFNVKNQMVAAAENGARSVALYGGSNTLVRDKKGNRRQKPEEVVKLSIPEKYQENDFKIVEVVDSHCGYLNSESNDLEQFTNNSNPKNADKLKAGDMVYCDVVYKYHGIAGRFGLFNLGETLKGERDGAEVLARGTSVSEVTIE